MTRLQRSAVTGDLLLWLVTTALMVTAAVRDRSWLGPWIALAVVGTAVQAGRTVRAVRGRRRPWTASRG